MVEPMEGVTKAQPEVVFDPEQAEQLKNQGNEAFKVGDYLKAIELYS